MSRSWTWIVMLSLVGAGPGLADEPSAEPAASEMKAYQMVILREADLEEPLNDERRSRLKTAHDHWVRSLINYEVAVVAGPVDGPTGEDENPIREVAIMAMASTGEAASAFQGSTTLELGVLDLEVYPLWAATDAFAKPRNLDRTEPRTLGFLRRPADAPSYPEEELRRLQEGHLANIGRMSESGDLLVAGPLENAADLRGILVFGTRDERRIREMVAEDPAVQAGRLVLDLYRWEVPRGVFSAEPPGQRGPRAQ